MAPQRDDRLLNIQGGCLLACLVGLAMWVLIIVGVSRLIDTVF